jgi:hypothetical protein
VSSALYFVMFAGLWPLWLAAGVADWACHRRTDIERTSGLHEWGYHALQGAQIGATLLLAVFAEVTTLVMVLIAALVLWHWQTAYVDTRYTHGRRDIRPFEQTVHAVMELVPLFAAVLLALAHPEVWQEPRWTLEAKRDPVPLAQVLGFLGLTVAVQLTPLLEEGLRCLKAERPGAGSRR